MVRKQTNNSLTESEARARALKGWETRRRHNPYLKNIDQVDTNQWVWHRPNEDVEIKGRKKAQFTPEHVELMAPGLATVDKHLKKDVNMNIHIQAKKMSPSLGGYYMNTGDYKPEKVSGVTKWYVDKVMGIPKEDWGNRHSITMNTRQLDKPNASFHPTGIMTHELGHAVGPGPFASPTYKPDRLVGLKRAEEFGEAFQWAPPVDKHGNIDKRLVDVGTGQYNLWNIRSDHPQVIQSGKNSYKVRLARQTHDMHEDWAESFRSYLGMPIDIKSSIDHNNNVPGDPFYQPGAYFNWKDSSKKSRKKYMKKYVLDSASKTPQRDADLVKEMKRLQIQYSNSGNKLQIHAAGSTILRKENKNGRYVKRRPNKQKRANGVTTLR